MFPDHASHCCADESAPSWPVLLYRSLKHSQRFNQGRDADASGLQVMPAKDCPHSLQFWGDGKTLQKLTVKVDRDTTDSQPLAEHDKVRFHQCILRPLMAEWRTASQSRQGLVDYDGELDVPAGGGNVEPPLRWQRRGWAFRLQHLDHQPDCARPLGLGQG
jgi:hypothetical protein